MQGWIKLHRELLDKPIWKCSKPEQKAILVTLLLMANHDENEWVWQGKRFKCEPGQFVTSLGSIAEESGTTIQSVRTALKNFSEIHDFLTDESTKTGRLVTIKNWSLYQSEEPEPTKLLADDQQTTNRRPTTNKNDKNDKNKIYGIFSNVKLSDTEYKKLITDYGEQKAKAMIEYLSSYRKEKGYKNKSDYLSIRRWVSDAVDKQPKPKTGLREVTESWTT